MNFQNTPLNLLITLTMLASACSSVAEGNEGAEDGGTFDTDSTGDEGPDESGSGDGGEGPDLPDLGAGNDDGDETGDPDYPEYERVTAWLIEPGTGDVLVEATIEDPRVFAAFPEAVRYEIRIGAEDDRVGIAVTDADDEYLYATRIDLGISTQYATTEFNGMAAFGGGPDMWDQILCQVVLPPCYDGTPCLCDMFPTPGEVPGIGTLEFGMSDATLDAELIVDGIPNQLSLQLAEDGKVLDKQMPTVTYSPSAEEYIHRFAVVTGDVIGVLVEVDEHIHEGNIPSQILCKAGLKGPQSVLPLIAEFACPAIWPPQMCPGSSFPTDACDG